MSDLIRTLLLLALAGAAVTLLGSAAAWWRDEERRLRRMLARALDAPAELVILARDRGLAAGLNQDAGRIAVLWDTGRKGLVYRLDQLVGAELIVDDQVAARAFRNEQRRPLDQVSGEAKRIMLRLVFDNPRDPDFELPLWPPADPAGMQRGTALDALQAARRWVSSVEAILRRTAVALRPEPAQAPPPPAAYPPLAPPPADLPLFAQGAAAEDQEDDEDGPPWDDEDEHDDPAPGRSDP